MSMDGCMQHLACPGGGGNTEIYIALAQAMCKSPIVKKILLLYLLLFIASSVYNVYQGFCL